jgi:hypothetical protein
MAGEFILSVAYGIDALPVNDPYISLAAKTVKSVSNAAVPGRFLVASEIFSMHLYLYPITIH